MKALRTSLALLGFAVAFAACHVESAETDESGDGVAPWLAALESEEESTRIRAIDQLGVEGVGNAKVVDALTEQLDAPSAMVRAHAAMALGRVGTKKASAVSKLIKAATDPDSRVRRVAIRALARIEPPLEELLPLLGMEIRDADPSVRISALNALANVGKPAVPMLIEALKRDKEAYWACLVLAEIGPEAEAAVPALVARVDDPDPQIRREAVLALGHIGEAAAGAVPKLTELLDAETPGVPLAAAYALGQLGTAAKPATEELKKLANAEDPLQQTVALWALARANPKDKQWFDLAVPLLVERLTDADQQVREAAVRALADLEPPPGSLIPELKRVLDKADAETVSGALDALATLGEPAVPRLIAALEHDDARARAAAILGRIGPPAQEAVPALRDVLDDPDGEVRREAAFALGAMGEAASPAVPQLTELLQDPDMNVRYAAAYALGKIGPQAMEAKSELVKRLASPDRFLGLVAAWALARVHPECPATSPKSVPVLVKALEQPAPMVQLEAIEALRCLGPLAKDALPGLRELAESTDNAAIRQAAADAIEAIEN